MFYQNYAELTWEEIEKIDKKKSCIILPVASIEQHGKHLPVGTDDYILQMCMDRLKEMDNETGMTFYVIPKISIGKSAEHMNFPGTISFSVTTYYAILNDIVESISKHGFEKLIIVNGHGGNTALLNGFSQELNLRYGMEIYNLELPAIYNTCDCLNELDNMDIACDVHAGDIETSLMQSEYSQYVHMEKAVDEPIYLESYYNSWLTDKISKSGTIGKPIHGSKYRGELILNYMTEKMVEIISKIANM